MADSDKLPVIETLKRFDEQFGAILGVIADRPLLKGEDRQKAQDLLRDLKASLASEWTGLYRRRKKLNRYEKAHLEPAIFHAKAELSMPYHTNPGKNWSDKLYRGRISIRQMLSQLR